MYWLFCAIIPTLFLCSPHTNSISNSAILHNNDISLLSDLCACVHVKKNAVVKEATVIQWAVWMALWDFKPGKKRCADALLSEKCCCIVRKPLWKSRKFQLAHLKKRKKKNNLAVWRHFWFNTFAMLFSTTGCVFHHENTQRLTVGCYNSLS